MGIRYMAKKKGLHISKERLEEIIGMYGDIREIECINQVNGHFKYSIENANGIFKMNVFFRKDHTITCNVQGTDEEKSIGNKLVDIIYESEEKNNIRSGTFTCKISKENMEGLIGYLKEKEGVDLIKDEDKADNGHVYKFLDEVGDSITLTYYNNSTMLFQGYLMQLHTEVKCYLSAYEYVKTEIVEQVEREITGRENDVQFLIKKYLPHSYDKLNDYLKDQLYDSLNLIVIHNEMRDYTSWTFQGLKALEGRIKEIFAFERIFIDDKRGFRWKISSNRWVPVFNFDEISKKHNLNTGVINISDADTVSVLCDAYTFLNKHRSEIFHTKQIMAGTRRIDTPEEAEAIIFEICKIIEDSYQKLGR